MDLIAYGTPESVKMTTVIIMMVTKLDAAIRQNASGQHIPRQEHARN